MDELFEIYGRKENLTKKLDEQSEECLQMLRAILFKPSANYANENTLDVVNALSPRPKTKRAKRLPSLVEDENEEIRKSTNGRNSRNSQSKLESSIKDVKPKLPINKEVAEQHSVPSEQSTLNEVQLAESSLMPPPALVGPEVNAGRPKRLAKLKSEKNLKEPSCIQKLRRPSNFDASSFLSVSTMSSKQSIASTRSNESVVVVPEKAPSIVDLNTDDEQNDVAQTNSEKERKSSNVRNFSIKIKREKSSLSYSEQTVVQPEPEIVTENVPAQKESSKKQVSLKKERTSAESTKHNITSNTTTSNTTTSNTTTSNTTTTNTTTNKRNRKKKEFVLKPIKVERFSDIDKIGSPISSRTRKGSIGRPQDEQANADMQAELRATSIYEDAVDVLPNNTKSHNNDGEQTPQINNETITVIPSSNEAIVENPNATITLAPKNVDTTYNIPANATFNLPQSKDDAQTSFVSAKQSLETAKDITHPQNDSLITEDESFEKPLIEVKKKMQPPPKPPMATKPIGSAKAYKMPTRTNELFDPLIQSPVKMKVKAFESAASSTNSDQGRSKRTKENTTPHGQSHTPVIGKLHPPTVGRFLTPTQGSNITPSALGNVKKAPSSTSKVTGFPKSTTMAITKGKTLVRENSNEDFRKGLHLLAEDRKKQREQKHVLAAMQREAKERERAERMAKLAKEREEKRIKKQLEAEQKKRELEEIHRKLRQNEESAAAAAAAEAAKMKAAKVKLISDQERLMLQKLKHAGSAKSMLPPPPKVQNEYTFDMLHKDDSSDEETKVTYKRPPPPTWSRSQVRGPAVRMQQYWPTEIIDNFFSVRPMTADLRAIFPNIDAHQLRRNSSVLWSTPPRYSELPQY